MRLITIHVITLALCGSYAVAAETLTYVDLIGRLTDMEHLATLPQPGEKCAQWSSYDRASKYDESTREYVNWSANGDGTGIIRKEDGKLVLAEMEGPGVIWRIWSASAGKGHVRIYLDDRDEPAVDLPFGGYFNLKNEPFTREALAYRSSGGFNCYVPIPYRKSCKIVADPHWGRYYHFTYTSYPRDTRLSTFTCELSPEESAALDRANRILGNCGTDPAGKREGEANVTRTVTVQPGQTVKVVDLEGPRAITTLRVKMDVPDAGEDNFGVLRELALRITWDDQAQPAVWSPLGDFFGTAPGVSHYRSLPMGMTRDGFYSYWYMPFVKRGLVELTNDGGQARTVTCTLAHAPLTKPIETLGHFHARWHRDADLDPRRPIDWTLLKTTGRGRYCGVMLYVWNPRGGWWGEGDEKFFIDGEKFPSTFGTGSEDYFGYAWCSHLPFNRAYHNQTVSVANNGCANQAPADSGGHISNNRFHVADNVPFCKSFEGAIEKYFSNDRLTRYACVAYWYQDRPFVSGALLASVEERLFKPFANEMVLYRFYKRAKEYAGDGPVEPLREMYRKLIADARLAAYHIELTLKMARGEQLAGHDEQARSLLEPMIEPLTQPFVVREFAADIRHVLDKPASEQGLIHGLLVTNPDGSVKRVKKEGRWAVVTQRDKQKQYVYFSVPEDAGIRKKDHTITFTVDFYSTGQPGSAFRIQYDSHYSNDVRGFYHNSDNVAVPADKVGWHTAIITCRRARLAGHQNNKADFRIATVGDGDVFIGDVQLQISK